MLSGPKWEGWQVSGSVAQYKLILYSIFIVKSLIDLS